jgi:hypothetical protein
MTLRRISEVLTRFEEAGLLQMWVQDGKTWAYFVGIEKSGRLPSGEHLKRYKNLPPGPPSPGIVPDKTGNDPEGFGLVCIGLDRLGKNPGKEADVLAESTIKERARIHFPNNPVDKLSSEQRKTLRQLSDCFGIPGLAGRYDAWAPSQNGFCSRPLAAFLGWKPSKQDLADAEAKASIPKVSPAELKACVLAIAKASSGDVVLGPRHQTSVAEALAEFGHDTVLLAFKDFWAGFGGEKKWAELDFSGKVGIYCELAVERKRKEAELAAQLSAARQAEIAKGEAEAARVDEEDLLAEEAI